MRLSISNIGWDAEQDHIVYSLMKKYGFSGLEIAPTRIFPDAPYDRKNKAAVWASELKENYGFCVPSMQSIWFGRQEKLFGTEEERSILLDYTKKAIEFAASIHCGNLVFGCPKNRVIPDETDPVIGIRFFKEIGDYAYLKGTAIGIEANPSLYGTNYINNTAIALDIIGQVNSKGFLLNLDVGTMVQNKESVEVLKGKVKFINHIHISEPGLTAVKKRRLHQQLKEVLATEGYEGFVSIEIGKSDNLKTIETSLYYVKETFG